MSDTPPPIPDAAGRTVTLDDVARIAKVSAITVSRVINRPHLVSERTAKRVRSAIARTGYVPNLLAGGLVSQRSRLVIALVPSVANPAFTETMTHLGTRLAAARYQLLLCQSELPHQEESTLIDAVLSRRPDALVLTKPLSTPTARQRLLARGLPVVESWELNADPIEALVGFSHAAAGAAMARHMLDHGYQRIGLLWSEDQRAETRRRACLETLIEAGVAVGAQAAVPVPVGMRHGREGLARLLEMDPRLDAVICSIDLLAQGVLAEAQARGLRVPHDLGVLGFGDFEFAAHTHPRLSTVRVDSARIGELAADHLLRRLEGDKPTSLVHDVGFELLVREST
ncbi:LacI family DNA-binding transcriptional regulator [Stutzerimonas azotifigens]|uniref:LacI family DNA-binding transcriptional regulator n=1 Tax=Stutzerimonas azotifigens TaxID=291995 RepID=UPI00048813CC|nr:LacI family DNA-binding transcriptional regulator [Stutzerimonas azotifigens]